MRTSMIALGSCLVLSACGGDELEDQRGRLEKIHAERIGRVLAFAGEREAALQGDLTACRRALEAAQDAPKIGATYTLAIGDRVMLTNRRPLSDGVRRFRKGGDCRIDPGGTMTVLGARLVGEDTDPWVEYLVRYAKPPAGSDHHVRPQDDAKPYACPDGATFHHDDLLGISEPAP